ncbi:MAG TPA: response regulator [Burkholderiales bacterium]|nr:response regulator [Burkholderiales bacterium]
MRQAVVDETRHRLLIVDDEESTRLVLARMLSRELKAEVQLAGTSVQALKFAENYAYDAIVLDLIMPGMDGFELLRRIRAGTPNARTPVIVVSVLGDEKDRARAIARGASAYHVKPVRRAELVALVRAQLGARAKPTSTR